MIFERETETEREMEYEKWWRKIKIPLPIDNFHSDNEMMLVTIRKRLMIMMSLWMAWLD